jgi:hypothetical protein
MNTTNTTSLLENCLERTGFHLFFRLIGLFQKMLFRRFARTGTRAKPACRLDVPVLIADDIVIEECFSGVGTDEKNNNDWKMAFVVSRLRLGALTMVTTVFVFFLCFAQRSGANGGVLKAYRRG